MINQSTNIEIKNNLIAGRLSPNSNRTLYTTVRSMTKAEGPYYVLRHIIGQTEDFYVVLLDRNSIIEFELSRNGKDTTPSAISNYSFEEYKKSMRGSMAIEKLKMALELTEVDSRDRRTT